MRRTEDHCRLIPNATPYKAHDFKKLTWRHLNFSQHHYYLGPVPRTNCPEHGVKRIQGPRARKRSRFTLLFEQAAMIPAREMPVPAAARIMGITDQRLWRIVNFSIQQAMHDVDLSSLATFGPDETAFKRDHNYLTVFIDLERTERHVIFATPGKGRQTGHLFKKFLEKHGGEANNIVEVVFDMSSSLLAATEGNCPLSCATAGWFQVVQLFTKAIDKVCRAEFKDHSLPKATRWAVVEPPGKGLTESQIDASVELETAGLCITGAGHNREMLRWVNKALCLRAAKWRMGNFINYARKLVEQNPILSPMANALNTLENHKLRILRRWRSCCTNARLEGLNSLFQGQQGPGLMVIGTPIFLSR